MIIFCSGTIAAVQKIRIRKRTRNEVKKKKNTRTDIAHHRVLPVTKTKRRALRIRSIPLKKTRIVIPVLIHLRNDLLTKRSTVLLIKTKIGIGMTRVVIDTDMTEKNVILQNRFLLYH